jgi:hypothetical protein
MNPSYKVLIGSLGELIAGVQKHPPSGVMMIGGTNYTMAEIVSLIQSIINALSAVVAARQTYQDAVKASETIVEDNRAFVSDFKQSVKVQYGQAAAILGDFGLTPRKIPVKPLDVKVTAAAKAGATRTARGTKGKKQKAAITGNVTGVNITPVTAPATAAPAAPPAVQPAATTPAVAAPGTSVGSH